MFAALVVSQAYSLRETVAVLQQPGGGNYGSTIPELVGKSIVLIVAIAFLNTSYAINEIKAILPWVLKSPKVIFNFWREKTGAWIGDMDEDCCGYFIVIPYLILSALLALAIIPLFALVYPIYKHLEEDVWNAVDLIYTSLVWASLGYHAYIVALLVDRSAESGGGNTPGAVASAASLAVAAMTPESLSLLSNTALGIAGWSIIFVVFRLLSYFRSTRTIGPIIAMIMAIIRDMLPFMIVLFLLMAGGAFAMPLLMGVLDTAATNAEEITAADGFADPQRSFVTIYMWLNGDWDVAAYESHTGALAYFYLFLLLTSIVMMNLLIAIMGDSFNRVREQQRVQARIVRAQIINEIEQTMPKSDKDRPCWHRCLPKWLRPWCMDDLELNPVAVLRVVKDTDADDADESDAAEWGGRLAEMRKTVDATKAEANTQFTKAAKEIKDIKEATERAEDRAAKADASAAVQVADLKREIKDVAERADARAAKAEATMDALVDAIRALSEGGSGGGRGIENGAIAEKRCRSTAGGQEMEVAQQPPYPSSPAFEQVSLAHV